MPKKAVTNENTAEQQEQNAVVEESEATAEAVEDTVEAEEATTADFEDLNEGDAEFEEDADEELEEEYEEMESYMLEADEAESQQKNGEDLEPESEEAEEEPEAEYEGADEIEVEKTNIDTEARVSYKPTEISKQMLTRKMKTLIAGAVYKSTQFKIDTVFTGVLTGVTNTSRGVYATVSYNSESDDDIGSAQVFIPFELMGYDSKLMERNRRRFNRHRGVVTSPQQFTRDVNRAKFTMLRRMLGAKVDFVPIWFDEETNFIRGDRARAMEIRRKNFTKRRGEAAPRIVPGNTVNARVVRISSNGIVIVEASGYECKLRAKDISALAVDAKSEFEVGDNMRVVVRSVSDNRIRVVGRKAVSSDVSRIVHEYIRGSVVLAKVMSVDSRGTYHLKMPNGCRGTLFISKATLHKRPVVGKNISVSVIGFNSDDDTVKCALINN